MTKKIIKIWFAVFIFSANLSYAKPECEEGYRCGYAFSLYGEPKYKDNFQHLDYVNPNAPKGGRIKYAEIGTFNSLNPFVMKGVPASGITSIYDSLLTQTLDEPFSYYGLVADYTQIALDNKSVIFHLNERAKFHDGSQITAKDVKFTFDTLISKGHITYKNYLRDVEKCEVINKSTVKYSFKTNKNREIAFVVGSLPILSSKFYEKNDFANSDFISPLGSSAYRLDSFTAGKTITYKRVDNYWAKDLPIQKGLNNFDYLQYDYYRDVSIAIEAFKAGEYDIREENIAKIWNSAYNIPQVEKGEIIKETIPHKIPTGMQAFVFNLRRDKFRDKPLRQAISYAFDFEWTNKNLFNGAYKRTKSFFSNSDFASKGFELPVNDGSGNNRKYLIQAKNILESSGYYIKDFKLIYPKNHPLSGKAVAFEILLNSNSFERVLAPFVKNLRLLGIEATIKTIDTAQYSKKTDDFNYDMIVNVFGASLAPGNEQFNYWHSKSADNKGSGNVSGIKNAKIDGLVEKIINTTDYAKLKNLTKQLDLLLLQEYIVIPNWNITDFRIIHWNKFGKPKTRPTYALGVGSWWERKAVIARKSR
ncbi:MAG: extracellular solute-binding protein [Alphaproteobacteria bacterium]